MNRLFVFEYLTGGVEACAEAAARRGADEAATDHGIADTADTADIVDTKELAAQGRAMRDAVAGDLARAGLWSVSTAVGAWGPDAPSHTTAVQAHAGESSLDFVARQSALHDQTWVIAPETDGVLAQLQRCVGPLRWIGSDGSAVRTASSKRATLLRLAGRGLSTPLAFERLPGVTRWVVKPDDGAGAMATQVHASRDAAWADFERRARSGAAMSIEPWVEGEALSLSLHCQPDSAELLSINRQRIAVEAGGAVGFHGVELGAVPLNDLRGSLLQTISTQVARAIPGLRGFVGIDLVWHPQRGPVIIEVNPRVTSAYAGLSAALGRNIAAEIASAHLAGLATAPTCEPASAAAFRRAIA